MNYVFYIPKSIKSIHCHDTIIVSIHYVALPISKSIVHQWFLNKKLTNLYINHKKLKNTHNVYENV